ncbi:hypothetical protein B0H16DRAFT_1694015 [Mycena metata]|uniref:Uncharacterized protein n=1 Tax=Mycena metata TaxID=1033252 RepID=A0AAD7N290_9AGAR|nr:hypothetical protein B0H16DRAFT_1694015 [Mycena metata]
MIPDHEYPALFLSKHSKFGFLRRRLLLTSISLPLCSPISFLARCTQHYLTSSPAFSTAFEGPRPYLTKRKNLWRALSHRTPSWSLPSDNLGDEIGGPQQRSRRVHRLAGAIVEIRLAIMLPRLRPARDRRRWRTMVLRWCNPPPLNFDFDSRRYGLEELGSSGCVEGLFVVRVSVAEEIPGDNAPPCRLVSGLTVLAVCDLVMLYNFNRVIIPPSSCFYVHNALLGEVIDALSANSGSAGRV